MHLNPALGFVNIACDLDHSLKNTIDEKQKELNEISTELSNDAQLLRKLRIKLDEKKDVDLNPLRNDIARFQKQYEKFQSKLDPNLRNDFDFNKILHADAHQSLMVNYDTLQDLIEKVESSKTHLEHQFQPQLMDIEAQIRLVQLFLEICRLAVKQQTDSVLGMISRAGR